MLLVCCTVCWGCIFTCDFSCMLLFSSVALGMVMLASTPLWSWIFAGMWNILSVLDWKCWKKYKKNKKIFVVLLFGCLCIVGGKRTGVLWLLNHRYKVQNVFMLAVTCTASFAITCGKWPVLEVRCYNSRITVMCFLHWPNDEAWSSVRTLISDRALLALWTKIKRRRKKKKRWSSHVITVCIIEGIGLLCFIWRSLQLKTFISHEISDSLPAHPCVIGLFNIGCFQWRRIISGHYFVRHEANHTAHEGRSLCVR